MQKPFSVFVVFGATILISGCTNLQTPEGSLARTEASLASTEATEYGTASVQTPQSGSVEMALAKQNVQIYDVAPPNASPLGQLNATACDGTREVATDKLIVMASQRGGNGVAQLSCKEEGISWSCWKSATCTGTAINIPPPPVIPPPTRRKTTVKKRAHS